MSVLPHGNPLLVRALNSFFNRNLLRLQIGLRGVDSNLGLVETILRGIVLRA